MVESEIWPNLISALKSRNIPAALINGRISERSFRRWKKAPRWAKELLSTFGLCLAQTETERRRFAELGANPVQYLGNLKFAAKPLPYNPNELGRLKSLLSGRKYLLFSSTHEGEESLAADIHRALKKFFPDLLTMIVPRHPVRADDIRIDMLKRGLSVAQRTHEEEIKPTTDIYIADTMGELGLFYRLAPVTVMGGSFIDFGGHNPIEPAQLGSAIIVGPHMFNFAAIVDELLSSKAALRAQDFEDLERMIRDFLTYEESRLEFVTNARAVATANAQVVDRVIDALLPILQPLRRAA
jgi:3-deoxy-D-manno-octulosonic-acid transferase